MYIGNVHLYNGGGYCSYGIADCNRRVCVCTGVKDNAVAGKTGFLNFSDEFALYVGLIFGVFPEIAVFMAAYIPLRSFAGGYHAKTPLSCYVFSVIMLIVVSIGLKYLHLADWVYYAVLVAATLVVLVLSPVEDRNKPLAEIEQKVYKKRTMNIAAAEVMVCLALKFVGYDNLFVAVVYSFVVLSFMLVAGKVKNHWSIAP